ncbi:permease-like cell division protein FtsX [Dactylosporangium cerinum]|uniref:Permease-like cell division protein FtsX n=1 Tax=Dactylosporangium cerinum TaxID=1434730 RepID=A0ABV9W9P3_9ACTN
MFRSLATVVALALFASPLSGCTGDDPDPLPARISALLDRDADAQQAAIEARIRAVPAVTSVTFVSREAAWERFKQQFADAPDLIAGTKPDSLPASFEATVADGSVAEAVALVIGTFDGITDTTLRNGDGDVTKYEQIGVLVPLKSGVTDGQRAAVEQLIRGLPRTASIRYETGEQTKARLLQRCKGKGDLAASLEKVDASEIPASFRFRIGLHGGKIPQLADLQRLDGVEAMLFVPVEVI